MARMIEMAEQNVARSQIANPLNFEMGLNSREVRGAARLGLPVDNRAGISGVGNAYYDNDLQMFKEPERDANIANLRFLRYLAEQGRLEHRMEGKSVGTYALEELTLEKRVPS